jgi:tRNA(adenine34) deaminase
MEIDLDQQQQSFLREAINLAKEAERRGNLPIGAVLVLDGKIIAIGMNSIWKPTMELTRHAEMEALRSAPANLWSRSKEMTLFTTLEPCIMCAGAILLHRIGHLVFGSTDPYGGVGVSLGSLPPYFREEFSHILWEGPILPSECDALYKRIQELERLQNPSLTSPSTDA